MNYKDSVLGLIDKKTIAVIVFLFQNPTKEFCLNEISEGSKVPVATVYRILRKLTRYDLIKFNKIKSLRLYKISNNDAIEFLRPLFEDSDAHLAEFIDLVSPDPNIYSIIQYGKESKDRINLLVIGDKVDSEPVKGVVYAIKEKYGITLNTLVLEPDQYVQMSDMGLYSGRKKELFSR